MIKAVAAIAGILLALLAVPISRTITHGNIGKQLQVVVPSGCKTILQQPENGGWQCEDMALFGPHQLLMACGDASGHDSWFPPLDRRVIPAGEKSRDRLFVVDTKSLSVTPVSTSRDGELFLHGIAFQNRSLLAVNHLPSGSVVDSFQLADGGAAFVHKSRFKHPLLVTPNNLVAYGDGFFVTNDHRHSTGPMRDVENAFQMPWASLVYCWTEGEQLECEVHANIPYANGVAIFDGKLYVSSTTTSSVHTFALSRKNGRVYTRPSTILPVPFMPDNIMVVDDRLFVAGFPKLLSMEASRLLSASPLAYLRKFGLISRGVWGSVAELTRHETDWFMGDRMSVKLLFQDDGSSGLSVQGATVGVVVDDKLFIGSIFGKGVTVCPLKV